MKYQTISLQEFFAVKVLNYHLAIAKVIFSRVKNMLFSGVKISCFCAKAYPVYHWCLYNTKSIFTIYFTLVFIEYTSKKKKSIFTCLILLVKK